ncbi:MAG: hypothetical protein JWM57_3142 [Phycisphaerales bacterium]|nr:hypothetical protein [Phycisphaerales bacterium]
MLTSKSKQQLRSVCARAEAFHSRRQPGLRRATGTLSARLACLAVAVGAVQVFPGTAALAISGTWSNTATGGSWGTAGNWFSGNVADGSGSTADFSALNLTADNTVNMSVSRTIGNLVFGDTTPSHDWTLLGNGFSLGMAVASGTPQITVNNQTTYLRTVLTGSQGLAKAGAGTLLLNGANVYAGGTTVNQGTLGVYSTGASLPTGGNVTVNSGATFNYGYGNTINNSGSAIGTLTLNNGTYRVPAGTGDFYLNQLVIGATGGTIDLTGTTNYWTHFTGAGAGITVNADSTWTGAGTSQIRNDTSALLPIAINSGTVTSSVNFANGTAGFGYRLSQPNYLAELYLKSPTSGNTADFRIESSTLQVDDMAALGSGTITLAGSVISAGQVDTTATLRYRGTTAGSSKALTLDASGGVIFLSTSTVGATLTLNGLISETGGTGRGLTVNGGTASQGVLALTAANTYTGPTAVNFYGIVSIPTIANGGVASPLGASSNASANLRLGGGSNGGDGTLRYTGPTASTDRGATLQNASFKSTLDVATAGTTLTMSGQIVGPGALTKAGAGTLLLTGTANTYANGTTVDAGTLAVGASGAVLPSGKNLTVNSGATFNYGNGAAFNNISAPIGTLTLNNGAYRVSGGNGDFYLNQLVVGATGGTVDFTGTSAFYTHFTGSGAAITVDANSTWTGASGSHIQNDTSALLPITLNTGAVTSSVNFVNGSGGFGYRLTTASGLLGQLYLKNPTSGNTADFRVEYAFLRVDDMAALGSGAITLAGAPVTGGVTPESSGVLMHSGPTASSAKALSLDADGGIIYVYTPFGAKTLTLSGVISETGGTGRALAVWGGGGTETTLALTAANTYTGPTFVSFNGVLSIPTIANGGVASPIGASSNAPANLRLGGGLQGGNGTLRYTGPTASTNRGMTLNSAAAQSTIDVNTAGTTLTMSGQIVGPGALTKAGPGTLLLTGTSNTYANGTIIDAGTLAIGAVGAVLPAGKNVTVNSGATFDYSNSVSNSAAPIGTLALNNGTYRVSSGNGDFYLNKLNIGATGGTVNFSGAGVFFAHLVNAGAGINVSSNSTWIGGGGSRIQNDTAALIPFTINPSATLTTSVNLGQAIAGNGFRLDGGGTLYIKNPTGSGSAPLRLETGILKVDDMGALGSGEITLAGTFLSGTVNTTAVLTYGGATASSSKPLSLDVNGGIINVGAAGANLTLSGVISETGGTGRSLSVIAGAAGSVLTLSGANSYTGPTAITAGGTLSIPTIANGGVASPLGASSSASANLRLAGGAYAGDGTLRYTGATASTDRGVTLNSNLYKSIIEVTNPASTLAFSGQFVGGGTLFKTGPGTLRLTGANTYFATTTVQAGTLSANTFAYTTVLNTSNDGLDIQGGKFVFDYTGNVNPVATIKTILTNGYGLASKFSFGQIRDTTLAANLTLGYGDSGTAVTVMLTLPGDANLDGSVNFNDFLVLQNNFNAASTRFDQGNFNYDGVTDFNDFLVLQNNFGQSITGISVPVTASEVAALSAFASANAPVPEPTSLAMIGVGIGLLGRRRRQTN